MEREPKLDRPALICFNGVIAQQVGLIDDSGTPFQMALSEAIEKGYVKKGEIEDQSVPLRDFAENVLHVFYRNQSQRK